MVKAPSGATDLLVVGDRRRSSAHMDHEAQVRLVEPHPKCRGGHHSLDFVAPQAVLGRRPRLGVELPRVDSHPVPPVAMSQQAGQALRIGHREAVDDPRAG